MLGLLIAQVALAAAAPTTYEIGLRTEARGATEGGRDFQLNPALSLTAPIGSLSLSFSYTPRILVLEPHGRGGATLLHRGGFLGEWRMRRSARFLLDEQVSYGKNAFSLLVAAAEGSRSVFDRLVELPPLLYFSESTTVGIEQPLSLRLRLSANAAYAISGGADEAARSTVPLQRGPRAGLTLAWLVRSRDRLSAGIRYLASYFSSGPRVYLFEGSSAWRHGLSHYELELSLGVAGVREVRADGSHRVYAGPLATAALKREETRRRFHRFAGTLHTRLGPAVDPLSGFTYSRLEGTAELDYLPVLRLKLTASGGVARAMSGSLRGQSVGLGGLAASYEIDRHLSLTGGLRLVAQPSPQWVGFLAISLSYRESL